MLQCIDALQKTMFHCFRRPLPTPFTYKKVGVGKGRRATIATRHVPLEGFSLIDKLLLYWLRSDWWLIHGVSKFVGGLFCRKAFGNTDYLYWIREELQKVCLYEAEHTLPPLCSSITALQATASASSSKDNHFH